MKSSRRNGKNSRWLIFLICIAVTAGFGLMGPAMAMWGDSIYLNESVNTGDIEVAFQNPGGSFDEEWHFFNETIAWGVPSSCSESFDGADGYPKLYPDEDTIRFAVKRIDDDDKIFITFSIKNQGTIPVRVNETVTEQISESDVVRWKEFSMSDWVIDPGATSTGTITLKAHEGSWSWSKSCSIPIEIVRWNGDFSGSSSNWGETLYIQGTLNG